MDAYDKPLLSRAQTFMPYFDVILAGRQLIELEVAALIGQRKIGRVRNHDGGAHPSVKNVAMDADHAGAIEPLHHVAPFWQTDIEQRLMAHARVHGVKNRIAIF